MEIEIWQLDKRLKRVTNNRGHYNSPSRALASVSNIIIEEDSSAIFRFSFKDGKKRYKFRTLLKRLGYKAIPPLIINHQSFSDESGKRVEIPKGIIKNIS